MPNVSGYDWVGSTDLYRAKILPLRARAEVRNRWLKERLEGFLPELMKAEGFDMWIVIAREYNEDPVIMSLLPEPQMYARRRTILVFFLQKDGTVERLTISRYGLGDYYTAVWKPDEEEQYSCLSKIVRKRRPKTIGVNVSQTFAFGDGLTHNEYLELSKSLGRSYAKRCKGAERLAVGWLEHRTKAELDAYPGIVELTHAIVSEAFSSRIIHPGVTTTEDVVWWMRQKMLDLGLQAWFQPSVDIQAEGQLYDKKDPRTLILPGDMIHCDIGFYYLGLATDVQRNVYVLKRGEIDAPGGIKAVLADANRLQDIHAEAMVVGRTGNEILRTALERAKVEGINAMIYTHPLGYHGHAAGPTIGLWDQQGGVTGRGDYELRENTCYAIELNAKKVVPEWGGQEMRMSLEEDAVFTGGRLHWLSERQTRLYLVS